MSDLLCPCGYPKSFQNCCEPYIRGEKRPKTPEALMRSRYSAYTKSNIAYIESTMCGLAKEGFDPDEARQWAEKAEWLGLNVLHRSKVNHGAATVEFIARFRFQGNDQAIHENSEFNLIKGRWYYVSGKQL